MATLELEAMEAVRDAVRRSKAKYRRTTSIIDEGRRCRSKTRCHENAGQCATLVFTVIYGRITPLYHEVEPSKFLRRLRLS